MTADQQDPLLREIEKRIGTVIAGKYELREVLGYGATGAVYKAWSVLVQRFYALKVLHKKYTSDREVTERFKREAYAANRVRRGEEIHPNVVDTVDAGRWAADGCFFLVQTLLKGRTLEAFLEGRTGMPLRAADAVALVRPVVDAMAAAHAAGLVHRDLKPGNIFLVEPSEPGARPTPKVLDFGIAKFADARMTSGNRIMGTPIYMSPEAFTAPQTVDARADIWALGVILYEMLTGTQPFAVPDGDWVDVADAVRVREVPPLDPRRVPPALIEVLSHCFTRDRSARFADAGAMRNALDAAMAARPE